MEASPSEEKLDYLWVAQRRGRILNSRKPFSRPNDYSDTKSTLTLRHQFHWVTNNICWSKVQDWHLRCWGNKTKKTEAWKSYTAPSITTFNSLAPSKHTFGCVSTQYPTNGFCFRRCLSPLSLALLKAYNWHNPLPFLRPNGPPAKIEGGEGTRKGGGKQKERLFEIGERLLP